MKTYPLTQLWDRVHSANVQGNRGEGTRKEGGGWENKWKKIYAMWAGHQVVSQTEALI